MSTSELAQLELLAQIDDLVTRLGNWAEAPTPWSQLERSRRVLARVVQRVDPLRMRMDAPLVVATFGGTGVGKSSLVNALVGEDVAVVGRQRPTTIEPTLLYHRETSLENYNFPESELRLLPRESRLLRDWMLIDCPDPDTSESAEQGTNLERLHRILPACDVLLYVSTQQKYRSAKVTAELAQAAAGCRLIFIQTHADRDADIREDWRRQLEPGFRVADMFFVDSRQALREQQQGLRPTGDFGRLLDVLEHELTAAQRMRIRQGNLFGLVANALHQTQSQLTVGAEHVRDMQAVLATQRQRLAASLTQRFSQELLSSQGLWERRLLGEVAQRWGLSPFSMVLRAWHSQASLLASWTMLRARSTAQLALWGAVQGTRMWSAWQQERADLGPGRSEEIHQHLESEWQAAVLIVEGHARTAGLQPSEVTAATERLPTAAATAEQYFWKNAREQLDKEIQVAAGRHARWWVRLSYEFVFLSFPVALLYRIGRNFFYESWYLGQPLLESSFYLPAALFLLLWAAAILMVFTARLRRGLQRHAQKIAAELASQQLPMGLFPQLDQHCQRFHQRVQQLDDLALMVGVLNAQVAETAGLSRARVADESPPKMTR